MHDINKFVFRIAFITGFEFTVNNLKALLKFCHINLFKNRYIYRLKNNIQ